MGADGGDAKLAESLREAIRDRFGLDLDIIVRPARSWRAYRDGNPFKDDPSAIAKMVHLILSQKEPAPGAVAALREKATEGERVELQGDALWIDFGETGAGRSKLTPSLVNRCVGSPATARNLNTVNKLQQMIEARGRDA